MEIAGKLTILANRLADDLLEDDTFNKDKYTLLCNIAEFIIPKLQRQNYQVEDTSEDVQPVVKVYKSKMNGDTDH